ncbi:Protein BTR1 (Binding to ToMV RNA 1) [Durusdinium trenchii]|uniref:Protein BTR1 (Binding to ToMV RNA 1) n=1 Tax=Durusdinium trenchii TaxID=1381693 RepID=A0ABP0M7G8_9DINO
MQPPTKRPRTDSGWCISPKQAQDMQNNGPGFLKMLVSNATAGILIGKGGTTLKELEGATGCIIKLSPNNHFYPGSVGSTAGGGGHRVVCVAGKEEAVESVLATVVDATMEAERHAAEKEQRQLEDRVTVHMALPFSACGLVIGKGGTIQKEIQEQTGITVKITPKGNNVVPNERVASLTGVTQAVTAAAAQVFRLVVADPHMGPMLETPTEGSINYGAAQASVPAQSMRWDTRNDYTSAPPVAAPMAAKGGKGNPMASAPPISPSAHGYASGPSAGSRPCTIFFEVTNIEAAHIIGKGGAFLKSVCAETGAKVQLSKQGEQQASGTTNRLVTVTGPMTSVHMAHATLLNRAAEAAARS